ncbi:MAG: hypothetical protein RLY15_214 [Bacteroidota bacterium]|jgi:hypothetical protein
MVQIQKKLEMKLLANYLPGFHEDSFNNKWWYQGFTEWDNVKNASRLFKGHDQPRIPQTGYYNLASYDTIKEQSKLAKQFGISGFVIYNYWYSGVKLLHKPLEILLANTDIEIEFAICWANHDWTRSWSNRSGALDTLIKQKYEIDEECFNHAKYLSYVFSDSRYIKINGKPIFQVYDLNKENEIYLIEVKRLLKENYGIDILIVQTLKNKFEIKAKIADSVIYFQPSYNLIQKNSLLSNLTKRINKIPKLGKKYLYQLYDLLPDVSISLDYFSIMDAINLEYKNKKENSILSIFIDFDNTPRYKKRARYFYNFDLNKFEESLVQMLSKDSFGDIYVINAWNEWGEGMFLEPDQTYGFKKLEIIKRTISNFRTNL